MKYEITDEQIEVLYNSFKNLKDLADSHSSHEQANHGMRLIKEIAPDHFKPKYQEVFLGEACLITEPDEPPETELMKTNQGNWRFFVDEEYLYQVNNVNGKCIVTEKNDVSPSTISGTPKNDFESWYKKNEEKK
jgi:hypothetical protein